MTTRLGFAYPAAAMARRTLLLADDHPIFRRGLVAVLEEAGGYELLAQVNDGQEALDQCRTLRPDLAVLDIGMPELNGLDVLAALAEDETQPRVILLTMYDEYVSRAIELGARGYVLKDRAEMELLGCLEQVAAGGVFVSPAIAEPRDAVRIGDLENLTPAERRVLALVAEFKTSREIAEGLGVSHRTVQNHRARAGEKLGLKGVNALLRFAIDHRELL